MSELEDFLGKTLARQVEAERTLHNGNAQPRLEMWSRNEPVTVLGAAGVQWSGWQEVSDGFRWLASRFSSCQMYEFDLLAAGVSGDLAYTVGYERYEASREGGPVTPSKLRATHAYRRENGEWKIVHRHGDGLSSDKGPPTEGPTGRRHREKQSTGFSRKAARGRPSLHQGSRKDAPSPRHD